MLMLIFILFLIFGDFVSFNYDIKYIIIEINVFIS